MPSLETRERAEQRDGLLDEIVVSLWKAIEDLREMKESGKGSRELTHALTRAEESLAWVRQHGDRGEYAR